MPGFDAAERVLNSESPKAFRGNDAFFLLNVAVHVRSARTPHPSSQVRILGSHLVGVVSSLSVVGFSSIAKTIGVHTRNEIGVVISQRASDLSITKSRYGALVFEWWFAQGCPPVTAADGAMENLRHLAVAESQTKYGGKKK